MLLHLFRKKEGTAIGAKTLPLVFMLVLIFIPNDAWECMTFFARCFLKGKMRPICVREKNKQSCQS